MDNVRYCIRLFDWQAFEEKGRTCRWRVIPGEKGRGSWGSSLSIDWKAICVDAAHAVRTVPAQHSASEREACQFVNAAKYV